MEIKAKSVLPSFSFEDMRAMFRANFLRPTHRFLVALDAEDRLVGHSMVSRKKNPEGERFGSFLSRYVLPAHRQRGLGGSDRPPSHSWWKTAIEAPHGP